MRSLWYDIDGKPITAEEVAMLKMNDSEYYRIAETFVGNARVSTVWLGLDHSFSETGRPVIFETLVQGGKHDQHMVRYCTEDEARVGHARVVSMVKPWWRRWGITLRHD